MIRLYDTATRQVRPLHLRDDGKVSIYVCGPTVYGPPHLGHGRHVLVYDVLRRYLTHLGLEVLFVSNITDIDDKIINRAIEEDRPWTDVAKEFEELWWTCLEHLNVSMPDEAPHATDYVDDMVALIGKLIENGKAYVTGDGVYLSTAEVVDYGMLANQSVDNLVEGGGDREVVGTEKRHSADFALWKFTKPGEPSWPSPWGAGRPGWHTECVVMSLDLLGEGFDLHTGGLDLVFPHHENERAQVVALGQEFAGHWMHHGFVELEGEKMSKSLGNVMNLSELIEKYDPRAYRLLILQSHYRSPMEVTEKTLQNAEAAIARLDAFVRRSECGDPTAVDAGVVAEFEAAMNEDLNTARAVDLMFDQVRQANAAVDQADTVTSARCAETALLIAGVLGIELGHADEAPAEVVELASQRAEAKANKDFARADEIRDQLVEAGWRVEDSADGPVLSRL